MIKRIRPLSYLCLNYLYTKAFLRKEKMLTPEEIAEVKKTIDSLKTLVNNESEIDTSALKPLTARLENVSWPQLPSKNSDASTQNKGKDMSRGDPKEKDSDGDGPRRCCRQMSRSTRYQSCTRLPG